MKPKIVFLDEYSLAGRDLSAVKALGDYTGYDMTAPYEVAARDRKSTRLNCRTCG